MTAVCLHSKEQIEAALRRNTFLQLYAIGDLDDFFWPYTIWYGLEDGDRVVEVALLYTAMAPPILHALADEPLDQMRELLRTIMHLLPRELYAHLSGDLSSLFGETYEVRSYGTHLKMALRDRRALDRVDTAGVIALTRDDLPELEHFYTTSYTGNSFDPCMLETGYCFGIRVDGELASVAGIHVYSERYRVAAPANIATLPRHRGKGLATRVLARLCHALEPHVDHIGLNVKADNHAALAAYERLGFKTIATYEECELRLRPHG